MYSLFYGYLFRVDDKRSAKQMFTILNSRGFNKWSSGVEWELGRARLNREKTFWTEQSVDYRLTTLKTFLKNYEMSADD